MNALPASSRFTETPAVRRKLRQEALAKWIFCAMAAAMVVPLLLIVGYLVVRAAPSLNLEFLLEVPKRGMTEGGIWPALSGTLYLVFISLAVSAPIGILAAVYLNDKFFFATDKIYDIIINRLLSNKFIPAQASASQIIPHAIFCEGHVLS